MNQGDIPNFIKAKTVLGLRRNMLINNSKEGITFNYFDIQFVNGEWYAWFYTELKNNDELLNDEKQSARQRE